MESFHFHRVLFDVANFLDNARRLAFYEVVFRYMFDGVFPDSESTFHEVLVMIKAIRPILDDQRKEHFRGVEYHKKIIRACNKKLKEAKGK